MIIVINTSLIAVTAAALLASGVFNSGFFFAFNLFIKAAAPREI